MMADQPDQPFTDTTPYGLGEDNSITDVTENAAITHHVVTIGDNTVAYTARAGHLVTADPSTALPVAKFFYVSFTADGMDSTRPVTFFYNGGPGASAIFVLLGSFAPRRIKTKMPSFTPTPYQLEDNADSLLDRSDLVFINPVGTGYSAAIAPKTNKDFWGVDEDAGSIAEFIKRYLTVFDRWNSPKFLFGESYGTARSCVVAWKLHEDGVELDGVILQSSILDYALNSDPGTTARVIDSAVGLLPTLAADAWYHQKINVAPRPPLRTFMDTVTKFANGPFRRALTDFPKIDQTVLQTLSDYLGVSPAALTFFGLNVGSPPKPGLGLGNVFLTNLLLDRGLALGAYDGRVTALDTGIVSSMPPDTTNDPTITASNGVYMATWNYYLNGELKFKATSPFPGLNDTANSKWKFIHTDPTGAQTGSNNLNTAGDLEAAMALNPYLKVFSANGYYDCVTPFFQTVLTLENMLREDEALRANLTIRCYPSGHMIYLDDDSRTAMKADLVKFYESAQARVAVPLAKRISRAQSWKRKLKPKKPAFARAGALLK